MAQFVSVVNDGVMVVSLTEGRLSNEQTIRQLGKDLAALAKRCEEGKLLVNFEQVQFMSSAMLGQLVALQKECKIAKIGLKLCGISNDILQVFKITQLNKVFDIHPDEPTALKAFQGGGWWPFS